MTGQSVQENPLLNNLYKAVTPRVIKALRSHCSTVTLIYINMPVGRGYCRKETAT